MKIVLTIGWLLFLGFIVWEFVMANELPQKYSRLKQARIRQIDSAIAVLVLLSLWYIAAT